MDEFLFVIERLVLPIVVAVAVPVVLALATKWLRLREVGIAYGMTHDQRQTLAEAIEAAIRYAEEQGRKALAAAKAAGGASSGVKKLELAVSFAEAEIRRLGLDVVAREHLERLIESRIGPMRKDRAEPVKDD